MCESESLSLLLRLYGFVSGNREKRHSEERELHGSIQANIDDDGIRLHIFCPVVVLRVPY